MRRRLTAASPSGEGIRQLREVRTAGAQHGVGVAAHVGAACPRYTFSAPAAAGAARIFCRRIAAERAVTDSPRQSRD